MLILCECVLYFLGEKKKTDCRRKREVEALRFVIGEGKPGEAHQRWPGTATTGQNVPIKKCAAASGKKFN